VTRVATRNGCSVEWHGPSELKPVSYVCGLCSKPVQRTQRSVHFRKSHPDKGRVPRDVIHDVYRAVFVVKIERGVPPSAAIVRVCQSDVEALLFAEGVIGGTSMLQNCSADLFAGEKDATLRLVLR